MGKKQKVSFKLLKSDATRLETLEGIDISKIAKGLLLGYLKDGRRQLEDVKMLGIAWPTDWYEIALREWGERSIAFNIRRILGAYLHQWYDGLTKVESYRDYGPVKVCRDVKPNPGRQSTIQTVLIPQDWYETLLEEYGDGNVSTFVKSLLYEELKGLAKEGKAELSIPRRLGKFLG